MELISRTIENRIRWAVVMIFSFIMGILWIWFSAIPATATSGGMIPSPREGFPAPDFTLESLSGNLITFSDLRGKVVMVNIWASWCPPCRAEMPAIEKIYQDKRTQGLEVLAINTTFQDSETAAANFVAEFELTFPILLDRDGSVSQRYQLLALPTTYFIDRQGVIQEIIPGGPMSESLIESKIIDLLEETP